MTLYVCPNDGIVIKPRERKTLVETKDPWFNCQCGLRLDILGNGFRWRY